MPLGRHSSKKRTEGDELWSFSADWRTAWGNMERRAGYVLVRQGAPGDHFLTIWKDLPQEMGTVGSRRGDRENIHLRMSAES